MRASPAKKRASSIVKKKVRIRDGLETKRTIHEGVDVPIDGDDECRGGK